ncbi:MAG TPA: sulfotransferase [Caulobacteraceae bacterium]|nr:sulfotransferase [Caulobacteraceae bacterium]
MTQSTPPFIGRTAQDQQILDDIEKVVGFDLPRAIGLARSALARGVETPRVLTLVALQFEEEGRYPDAMRLLDRAAGLNPRDSSVWNSVGHCLVKQDKRRGAVAAFEHALALDPTFAQPYYNLGTTLEYLGDYEGAREQFERASRLFPDYADPLAGLATLAVRGGDWPAARAYAEQALALQPFQPAAIAALASADMNDRNHEEAERRLCGMLEEPGLDRFDKPSIHCQIGDALDGQGRYDEAFARYLEGKAGYRALYRGLFEGAGVETQLDFVNRLRAYFEAAPAEPWSASAPRGESEAWPARGLSFLVGFPRSGTTLLENVLASHPDVLAMDERATLYNTEPLYIADTAALDHLGALPPAEASRRRAEYLEVIRGFGLNPAGKVIVDKMPLYTTKLGLIFKLFPGAKILFALRDPRDVVLSCFRRSFQVNAGMYQFLTLDGAARFYDAVMRLAEVYRGKLPLDLHVVRYENLVADFEGEARAVCAFLGVGWTEKLHDFAAVARERRIRTPSAAQVRGGLYSGEGQWRRYAKHLEPVMPILAPWIERFGYASD